MRLGETRRSRFLLFGGLYFAQGAPWGFLTIALPVQLGFRGLGPAAIGEIVSAAWLPWAMKPALGPLVDRVSFGRFGRRRPFVLLAEAGMAVSLLLLMGIDPKVALALFSALVFVHNAFAAAQDVATDAMALDVLPDGERGRATGIMAASKVGGTLVGGPGLSWVGSEVGWPLAYVFATVLLLVPATLVLLCDEGPRAAERPQTLRAIGRELLRALAIRGSIVAVFFALTSGASEYLLDAMSVPFMKNRLGLGPREVNTLKTLQWGTGVGGALLGGLLADRLGRRRALFVGSFALAAAQLGFAAAAPLWPSFSFIAAYYVLGGLCSGVMQSTEIALFMDLANPRAGATHFQLYMSTLNLRATWAERVGGVAAERLRPEAMFGLSGLVELLPLPLLLLIDPAAVRRALAAGESPAAPAAGPGPEPAAGPQR
jgi:PAT family beta-lactamase induction signal transducer AmpG